MFGRKKQMEKKIIVKTKEELKAAIKRKEPCIEVQGDLAIKIKWIKKLTRPQVVALAALLASAAIPSPASPISAVVSMPAVTAITGSEIASIIFAGGVSAALILAILKGYNVEIRKGEKSMLLTKK